MSPTRHAAARDGSPVARDEFGHGIGRSDGVRVARYRSRGFLDLSGRREDFVHQLYWAPDGLVTATVDGEPCFIGPGEGFWVTRDVAHDVYALDQAVVYRVCVREAPEGLADLGSAAVVLADDGPALLVGLARPRPDVEAALAERGALLAGLRPVEEDRGERARARGGRGYALTVARALLRDPADPTDLEGWAERLHISSRTLQRDVQRCFGDNWTRWRTRVRLRAARALLVTHPVRSTATRVGYASASAFVAAYAREFGATPGGRTPSPRPRAPATEESS